MSVSGGGSCHPGCSLAFTAAASDADSDRLTYSWLGAGCSCSSSTSAVSCSLTALGTCTASVTVSDGHGHTVSASGSGDGVNAAPALAGPGSAHVGANSTGSFRFNVTDDDPANTGSCSASSEDSSVQVNGCSFVSGSGNVWQVNLKTGAPLSGGYTIVSATFTDKWGASGSVVVKVYVP